MQVILRGNGAKRSTWHRGLLLVRSFHSRVWLRPPPPLMKQWRWWCTFCTRIQSKTNYFTMTQTTDMHCGYIRPGSCIIPSCWAESARVPRELVSVIWVRLQALQAWRMRPWLLAVLLAPRKLRCAPVKRDTGQIMWECLCAILVVMKALEILWYQDSVSFCLESYCRVLRYQGLTQEQQFDVFWVIPHTKGELVPAGACYRWADFGSG